MNERTPNNITALPRVTIRDTTDAEGDFIVRHNGTHMSPSAGDTIIMEEKQFVVVNVHKTYNMDVDVDEPVLREVVITTAEVK